MHPPGYVFPPPMGVEMSPMATPQPTLDVPRQTCNDSGKGSSGSSGSGGSSDGGSGGKGGSGSGGEGRGWRGGAFARAGSG
ncbi:hypothetical protein PLESTF_001053400 [Pleodorina starrii]|nr:hypothetical protein PLESTF_001053400 [Pleodorina starrii]